MLFATESIVGISWWPLSMYIKANRHASPMFLNLPLFYTQSMYADEDRPLFINKNGWDTELDNYTANIGHYCGILILL